MQETIVRPADAAQLREIVAQAVAERVVLEARGGGSKRTVRAGEGQGVIVDLSNLAGVVEYEPSELVLTVRPATPLSQIGALLESHGQMLAFEPWDHGPLFGRAAGSATIGGIVAAGVAGSRRVSAGGARDHLLGFTAVSGRGEIFKAGGRVVKNVTGYDLAKVMAGSWGQLAIMTELSLKVVPRPRATLTIAFQGLGAGPAIETMAKAMGSQVAPAAAAHVPSDPAGGSMTLIRLEGFRESVEVRARQLADQFSHVGGAIPLDETAATELWSRIQDGTHVAAEEALWRVQIAPSRSAALIDALHQVGSRCVLDWGGALVWVGARSAVDVRALAGAHGGHAMLLRAPAEMLRFTPIRHPSAAPVAALTARVKSTFDPADILDPRRFG